VNLWEALARLLAFILEDLFLSVLAGHDSDTRSCILVGIRIYHDCILYWVYGASCSFTCNLKRSTVPGLDDSALPILNGFMTIRLLGLGWADRSRHVVGLRLLEFFFFFGVFVVSAFSPHAAATGNRRIMLKRWVCNLRVYRAAPEAIPCI
jgi:hypothetical protein